MRKQPEMMDAYGLAELTAWLRQQSDGKRMTIGRKPGVWDSHCWLDIYDGVDYVGSVYKTYTGWGAKMLPGVRFDSGTFIVGHRTTALAALKELWRLRHERDDARNRRMKLHRQAGLSD